MDKLQMEHTAPLSKTGLTTHFLGVSPTNDFSLRPAAVQYNPLHQAFWDHKSAPHDRVGAEESWPHSGWENQSDSSDIDASFKIGVDGATAVALCGSWDSWDDSSVLQHKRRAADISDENKQEKQHVGGGGAALGIHDCGSLLSDDRSATLGKTGLPPTAPVSGSAIIPLACRLDVAATEDRHVAFATLSAHTGSNDGQGKCTSSNNPAQAGEFQVKAERDESPLTIEVSAVGMDALGPLRASVEDRKSHRNLLEMGVRGKEHRQDELKPKREKDQEGGTVGSKGDATIGLKLGKRTYFEDGSSGAEGASSRAASSSPNSTGNNNCNSSTHITATSSNKKQKYPRCQAEGCKYDLCSAKEYHRRHKVCPIHSKASKVKVGNEGIEQRFCQQCSRSSAFIWFRGLSSACIGLKESMKEPLAKGLTRGWLQGSLA